MTIFQISALFLVLIAAVAWLNAKLLRLPQAVAMLAAGLIGAAVLQALRSAMPGLQGAHDAVAVISKVDFPETVVGYMLAFLLFAGAMQVDLRELARRRLSVLTLATAGVVASTALVGGGAWLVALALGVHLPLVWALVFGALISPTDPVAVLATVKRGGVADSLKAILQGEALFNDGVGIVVFLALTAVAVGGEASAATAALGVLVKAGGGLVFGLAAGFIGVRAMRAIDDHAAEGAVTLAIATGVYAGAEALHLSGPIAVVAAGLLVGDLGEGNVMSEETRRQIRAFWSLVDEILNAALFLLLGLELLVLPFNLRTAGLWMVCIPLVVLARLAVVMPWGAYFRFRQAQPGATAILTWGGLHGALSLALALSIPAGPIKPLILAMTYAVVVFSVGVQGLTFAPLVARLNRAPGAEP